MTAPGNDALLITALAAFTACLGYAAGRLHQWYRTVLDRDEAYRDGYDTATRSVFSLAARLIGPRRAVRGTVVVTSAGGEVRPEGVRPDPSMDLPAAGSFSVAPAAAAAPPSVPAAVPPASASGAALGSSVSAAVSSPAAFGAVPRPAASGAVPSPSPSVDDVGGRHFVPDELVKAPTYRLTPDRVARAKVRESMPEDDESPETTRLPSVPRPRAC
ncbi:hypothetical protein [Actinoplanes sp. ATCC 53533]|uniref:hypothetical protein n=1 Tax=Actinoplanes sp. ATCC 53533 TaxID=1288362 RepID=UPI000F7A63CF|nr:hypothetical protein [Actinoplanes sp. ATCC 53533]